MKFILFHHDFIMIQILEIAEKQKDKSRFIDDNKKKEGA